MIKVISGDIAQVEADAIVTAINSGRAWFGGIDGVIQRAVGGHFHRQANDKPLKDGVVVVATGPTEPIPGAYNNQKFNNVVFVVDDLLRPLSEIVKLGLEAADEAGYSTVSLPTIRMGVMAGLVESQDEAAKSLAAAAKTFLESAKNVKTINIVVYNNPAVTRLINEALNAGNN